MNNKYLLIFKQIHWLGLVSTYGENVIDFESPSKCLRIIIDSKLSWQERAKSLLNPLIRKKQLLEELNFYRHTYSRPST